MLSGCLSDFSLKYTVLFALQMEKQNKSMTTSQYYLKRVTIFSFLNTQLNVTLQYIWIVSAKTET